MFVFYVCLVLVFVGGYFYCGVVSMGGDEMDKYMYIDFSGCVCFGW